MNSHDNPNNNNSVNNNDDNDKHFHVSNPSLKKRALFNLSLYTTKLSAEKWNKITNNHEPLGNIYLGKIPTVNEAQTIHKNISKLGLVVSAVEKFETQGKAIIAHPNIQFPNDWKKMNINYYSVPIEDFTTKISIPEIIKAITKIHEAICKGEDVYIHCKAGVGRSAFIVACYLHVYGDADLILHSAANEVHAYLKLKRPSIKITEQRVAQFIIDHCEYQTQLSASSSSSSSSTAIQQNNLSAALNVYLAAEKTKDDIRQLISFHRLANYAALTQPLFKSESNRAAQINEFFNNIRIAENANWYIELLQNEGPIKSLLEAKPFYGLFDAKIFLGLFGNGHLDKRLDITNDFKQDLEKLLTQNLHCTPKELEDTVHSMVGNRLGI